MGIYDRDYGRDHYRGRRGGFGADWSMTMWLIVINVGVYVLQLLFEEQGFTDAIALTENWYERPWEIYRLVTCGFAHSTSGLQHILFNMIALFFFGRAVEMRYGSRELLAIYLAGVVVSALAWNITELPVPNREVIFNGQLVSIVPRMLGASGAISAILMIFILNFPHQSIFLYGIIELPAWLFGIIFLGLDIFGAFGRSGNVAYTAHLGGALFGFLYFRNGWRLADYLPDRWQLPKFGPKLKVHDPDTRRKPTREEEVDRILAKIKEQGQDSLTAGEKKTMEEASRRYQQRRGD